MYYNINIDVVHKPATTINNILCSKAKDRLDPMDKPGAEYHIKCEKHHADYVGETRTQTTEQMYNHRVISHKDRMRSHSLKQEVEKEEVELGTRRSNRNLQKVDYKAMHSGSNQMITTGDTIMSEHMALHDHTDGDISIQLLDFESTWGKRRINESITVRELRPSLNGNNALYLSPIYGLVPSKYS